MTINKMAVALGYFLLLLGALGFFPATSKAGGYIFGMIHVNAPLNLIHIATGAVFLWAGSRSECASLRTFQTFAAVYFLFTLLGNIFFNRLMIGPIAINQNGTLLHAMIAGVTFYSGYLSEFRRTVQCRA